MMVIRWIVLCYASDVTIYSHVVVLVYMFTKSTNSRQEMSFLSVGQSL